MFFLFTPFYISDAENQRKMSELTRKKDELTAEASKYNKIIESFSEIRELLTSEEATRARVIDQSGLSLFLC